MRDSGIFRVFLISGMWFLCVFAFFVTCGNVLASDDMPFTEGLVISQVSAGGRVFLHRDAIEKLIVTGEWSAPEEGDTVTVFDGRTREWERLEAIEPGIFEDERLRGWVYMTCLVETPQVMILRANHHGMVYVNGEPRIGDVYGYDWLHVPVRLKAGLNEFLFHAFRGKLEAELVAPKAAAFFTGTDNTLPDLVIDEPVNHIGAVVVVNATERTLENAFITVYHGPNEMTVTEIPDIGPLAMRKVPFGVKGAKPRATGDYPMTLALGTAAGTESGLFDIQAVKLTVKDAWQPRKITFTSDIDSSVQYFAFHPARPVSGTDVLPALVLSCHGAGVEATGLAEAYAPKSRAHIVCPTNRRPFGFDWEDWGRLDAMEVLNIAQKTILHDASRIYLTGHSMGGHGAWHLGVTFPDRFAAIGPSAGWISFWSYGGALHVENPTPVQHMLLRAMNSSNTKALGRNLLHNGVYILHGAEDNNVPVDQAYEMVEYLSSFHGNVRFHEEPGAGHWWDNRPDVPGVDCVDWPLMFDFFAHQRRPHFSEIVHVEFHTASPGVSARCHWASIESQKSAFDISSVNLQLDPAEMRLSGTTENVKRLKINLSHLPLHTLLAIDLDNTRIDGVNWNPDDPVIWLERHRDDWGVISDPGPLHKGSHRYGPFREVFQNKMVFVYGTQGNDDENAWAYAKARYDAEQFMYRGNGAVDVISDEDFSALDAPDRNVILYGNRDTNTAWNILFEDSPVTVENGRVIVGDRIFSGDDRGCLLVRPRNESDTALAAAVSGSGMTGMRLCNRLPYFVSGAACPDVMVFRPETLETGSEGVDVIGFFGMDWTIENGDFVFTHSTNTDF